MEYSNEFLAEARKAWDGEGLNARLCVRLNNTHNFVLSANTFAGWFWNNGVYSGEPFPPITLPLFPEATVIGVNSNGSTTYPFNLYGLNYDVFSQYESIVFACYVHRGTSTAFTLNFFEENTDPFLTNPFYGLWNWTGSGPTSGLHFVSASTGITSYGQEQVSSSWWKVWISREFDNDNFNRWDIGISPSPWDETIDNSIWVAAPSVDVDSLVPRRYINTSDFRGYPGDLVVLSGENACTDINPITRKREREFGIVQGQNIQATVANANMDFDPSDIVDCWVAVQIGYESEDLWELAAVGKIINTEQDTDGYCYLEIDDPVMSVIEYELPREYWFMSEPMAGEVKKVYTNDASDDYDNSNFDQDSRKGVYIVDQGAITKDEVYTLTFVSSTQFKISFSNGSYINYPETYTGSSVLIGTPVLFSILDTLIGNPTNDTGPIGTSDNPNAHVIEIDPAGFNTVDPNSYMFGDTFEFTVSRARTDRELTIFGMIKHLITDIVGVQVYDPITETYYGSPLADLDVWEEHITNALISYSEKICGYWDKGTRVIQMIQDALVLNHGTIFPTANGQIGHWVLEPNNGGNVDIIGDKDYDSGDPSYGIAIQSCNISNTKEYFANEVTYKYLDIYTGDEVAVTATDENSPKAMATKVVETGWRVPGTIVKGAAYIALNRFNYIRKTYSVTTTIAGISVDIDRNMIITEPMLNLQTVPVATQEKSIDIPNQLINFVGWNDTVAMGLYLIIDEGCLDNNKVVF